MKVVKCIRIKGFEDLKEFAAEHIDEALRFHIVTPTCVTIEQELELSEAETRMEQLRTLLECDDYLTDEEKDALEYSIDCIKTLYDMGILKGEQNND